MEYSKGMAASPDWMKIGFSNLARKLDFSQAFGQWLEGR